jgi:hypothetical protein
MPVFSGKVSAPCRATANGFPIWPRPGASQPEGSLHSCSRLAGGLGSNRSLCAQGSAERVQSLIGAAACSGAQAGMRADVQSSGTGQGGIRLAGGTQEANTSAVVAISCAFWQRSRDKVVDRPVCQFASLPEVFGDLAKWVRRRKYNTMSNFHHRIHPSLPQCQVVGEPGSLAFLPPLLLSFL